jgi:lysyl-tRNA synthetase class I
VFREREDIPIFHLSNEDFQRFAKKTQELLKLFEAKNLYEVAVKLIYGEEFGIPFRHLSTLVETDRHFDELIEAISLVKSYNEFEGEKVSSFLKRYKNAIDYIAFGREGSPLLLIHVRKGFEDKEKLLEEAKEELVPDEINIDKENYVRLWWD